MFDLAKLEPVLAGYQAYFPKRGGWVKLQAAGKRIMKLWRSTEGEKQNLLYIRPCGKNHMKMERFM